MRRTTFCSLLLAAVGCAAGAPDAATSNASAAVASVDAGDAPSSPADLPQSGAIDIRLVDAPNPAVSNVFVNVVRIDGELDGVGWVTLGATPLSVDLLLLQGGASATLMSGTVPSGHFGRLRLFLDRQLPVRVFTAEGNFELPIPTSAQAGIVIDAGFDVGSCNSGHITLDFDAMASLAFVSSGNWSFAPVVRFAGVDLRDECDAGAKSKTPTDAGVRDAGRRSP